MPGGRKRVHDAEEDDEDEMMRLLDEQQVAKRAKLTAVPPPLLVPVLQPPTTPGFVMLLKKSKMEKPDDARVGKIYSIVGQTTQTYLLCDTAGGKSFPWPRGFAVRERGDAPVALPLLPQGPQPLPVPTLQVLPPWWQGMDCTSDAGCNKMAQGTDTKCNGCSETRCLWIGKDCASTGCDKTAQGPDNKCHGCSETRGLWIGKDCAGTGCDMMATGPDNKCNGCSETRSPNYGTECPNLIDQRTRQPCAHGAAADGSACTACDPCGNTVQGNFKDCQPCSGRLTQRRTYDELPPKRKAEIDAQMASDARLRAARAPARAGRGTARASTKSTSRTVKRELSAAYGAMAEASSSAVAHVRKKAKSVGEFLGFGSIW